MATKKKKKSRQAKKVRKAIGQRTSKSGKSKQPRKSPRQPAVEEPMADQPAIT